MMFAVHKCSVQREHLSASSRVADILKNTNLDRISALKEISSLRRNLISDTIFAINKQIGKFKKYITDKYSNNTDLHNLNNNNNNQIGDLDNSQTVGNIHDQIIGNIQDKTIQNLHTVGKRNLANNSKNWSRA